MAYSSFLIIDYMMIAHICLFSAGGVVLVLLDESVRNQSPMARMIQLFKDSNGYLRSVKLNRKSKKL